MYYYLFFSSPVIFVAGLALLYLPWLLPRVAGSCLLAVSTSATAALVEESRGRPAAPDWHFSFREWLLGTIIFGLCIAWLSAMIESGPPRL